MTYNITLLKDVGTIRELFYVSNTYSGDIFIKLMMFGIFFVMLMALKRFGFQYALASSSFASFVLSLMLMYAGLLSLFWVLAYLALFAFTMFYIYTMDRT
jgi:hypothetical protein